MIIYVRVSYGLIKQLTF